MMTVPSSQLAEHNPLLRKLETIADLSDEERREILRLPLNIKVFEADTDIVREGDHPSDCCLILDGLTCRYRLLPDGRRQIMGFYIPGDVPDLQSLFLSVLDNSLGTLVTCRVAMIPHQSLRNLFLRLPNLAGIFWRDTLIDAAMFREWMTGLGRRSAYQRMAHLLCELQNAPACGGTRSGTWIRPADDADGTWGCPGPVHSACEPRAARPQSRRPDHPARRLTEYSELGSA